MTYDINVLSDSNKFRVKCQAFNTNWLPDTPKNRYFVLVFLAYFVDDEEKQMFYHSQLAKIINCNKRQSSYFHIKRFRKDCNEEFNKFVLNYNEINQELIDDATNELIKNPLIKLDDLRKNLNNMGKDRKIGNRKINEIIDKVPFGPIRKIINSRLRTGKYHYREKPLIEDMQKYLFSENKKEDMSLFEIEMNNLTSGMKLIDPSAIFNLLTPNFPLSNIEPTHKLMVFMMLLYKNGVSLSKIGNWFFIHKTTVLRYIISLSLFLYSIIYPKLLKRLKTTKCYCDEKWLKIRKSWKYWFVLIDIDTGIPIYENLMTSTSKNSCEFVLRSVQKFGIELKILLTDGLSGYNICEKVFNKVNHKLCIFHFQKGINMWLKKNIIDLEQRQKLKVKMLKIFKSNDKRTVLRRYNNLEKKKYKLGISEWFEQIDRNKFNKLLNTIGSLRHPKTTNEIERFFRNFNMFYKTKNGFFSLLSARRELKFFLLMYLFEKNGKKISPIEKIIPEIVHTPLYKMINDPMNEIFSVKFKKKKIKMAKIYEKFLIAS